MLSRLFGFGKKTNEEASARALFEELTKMYDVKTNIWIERICSTWKGEGSSNKGLCEQNKITDANLKSTLTIVKDQINENLDEEVVKTYFKKLQALYLYDNKEKSLDDYMKALKSAQIAVNKISFPKEQDSEKIDNLSERKNIANSITKLLNDEREDEVNDYLEKYKNVLKLIEECSKASAIDSVKKVYKELAADVSSKIISSITRFVMLLRYSEKYKSYEPHATKIWDEIIEC